jgi:mRNA interferase MazF
MASTTAERAAALRGEIWLFDPDPVRGHEQGGRRPALVISADRYNEGRAELVVVVPLTTRDRGIPLWVAIEPPEGGLTRRSLVQCDAVRSVSTARLHRRLGRIGAATLAAVEDSLRIVLDL